MFMAPLELRIMDGVKPLFSKEETRILGEIVSGGPTSPYSISERLGKNYHTVRTQLGQMRRKYIEMTGYPGDRKLEMSALVAGLVYWGKIVLVTSRGEV